MKKMNDIEVLSDCELILANGIRVEQIATALALYGYDSVKMSEGEGLFAYAKDRFNAQRDSKNDLSRTVQQCNQSWKELETVYRKVRKLAKVVFETQPELMGRLALTGKVPLVYVPFMAIVETLVDGLKADKNLMSQLAKFQITQSTLNDIEHRVLLTKERRTEYLQAKSISERLTKEKQAAIDALFRWCAEYIKFARIALTEKPQMLEALGIVVKR